MKKKSIKFKIGIALIVLQVVAYLGSVLNGSLSDLIYTITKYPAGGTIQMLSFNWALIVGIILIAIDRKKNGK